MIRLKSPVSYFDKLTNTKSPIIKDLSWFFDQIKQYDKYDPTLRQLYKSDKKKYDQYKKQLPGLVFGEFSQRKDTECVQYSPCMGFDIDGIKNNETYITIVSKLKSIKYIYSVFPSVSGHGLRILVFTEASKETHTIYYNSIAKNLTAKLDLGDDAKLDVSTKNISRLWFYAALKDDELYINQDAKTYKLQESRTQLKEISLSEDQRHEIITVILQNRNISGRNNYVTHYTRLSREHGQSYDYILAKSLELSEATFDENEINTTVNKNFHSSQQKYNDNQLSSYYQKITGKRYDYNQESLSESTESEKTGKTNSFIQIRDYLFDRYEFRKNEISLDIEVRDLEKPFYDTLNESDLICDLLEEGFKGVDRPVKALINSSKISRYNPLTDYLNSLPIWDPSKPDYIGQLSSYVVAKKQSWFDKQFKKMIVRLLACSLGHIPFNKHCFTLIGNQNDGKTSFLRFLCPSKLSEYYTETLTLDKDGRIALAQNLFINLDEIATISYKDLDKIKSLISCEYIKDRLPFGTKPIKIKRIANFFASTNNEEILTDSTGNVRWLIFEIDKINHDDGGKYGYNQNIDIDNVYSQAKYLLENSFKYKLTPEELNYSEDNNREHIKSFPELDLIRDNYRPDPNTSDNNFKTSTDLLKELQEENNRLQIRSGMIGRALKHLGYKRISRPSEYCDTKSRPKGYYLIAKFPKKNKFPEI